jgi:hypothetical protein
MLEKLHQPRLVEAGEEVADVSVEHEVHLLARDPGRERVQRIMLRAPRPEPVRETQKVLSLSSSLRRPGGDVRLVRFVLGLAAG